MNFFPLRYLLLLAVSLSIPIFVHAQQIKPLSIQKKLAALEASAGGRIGISAINTGNNTRIQYRAKERFPTKSTFKIMGVAAILKKSMTDSNLLQQKVTYQKQDLISWSPITEKHLADGMTIFELCGAAIMFSDSTAINLLIAKLGGPQAVTDFARSIGDNAFQLPNNLDQISTTPEAMEKSLQRLTLADDLGLPQREQLKTWLKNNTTGNLRIRAGVPKNWIVGDKTGTGTEHGTTNDIGIIWPPKCSPIVVSIYFTRYTEKKPRPDIIASATRMLINEFAKTDSCMKS